MKYLFILVLLTACTHRTHWTLDAIAAGDARYDSTRLTYQNQDRFSPLRLEFLKMGETIDLVLSLTQYSITPTQEDPPSVLVRLIIGEEPPFEEMVPLCEGHMRLRLSQETATKMIKALQEGSKIDILIDDLVETIQSDHFAESYKKFMGKDTFLKNFFTRPFQ